MSEETKEEFFKRGLPKWPGLIVSGLHVTKEQAAEILVRTDGWHLSGNDRSWEQKLATDIIGWPRNKELDRYSDSLEERQSFYGLIQKFRQDHDVLELDYMENWQIYSSWIGGPKGWCNWDGRIFCANYNIGKWPSVECVYEELSIISSAFPFLDMRVQLLNTEIYEGNEDKPEVVIEFNVREGNVTMCDCEKMMNTMPDSMSEIAKSLSLPSYTRERGCSIGDLIWAVNIIRKRKGMDLLR